MYPRSQHYWPHWFSNMGKDYVTNPAVLNMFVVRLFVFICKKKCEEPNNMRANVMMASANIVLFCV